MLPEVTMNEIIVLEKSQASSSSLTKKYILAGIKFQHVGRTMFEKLSMSKGSKDLLDTFAKGFSFSMVHARVNKCISNATIIEN